MDSIEQPGRCRISALNSKIRENVTGNGTPFMMIFDKAITNDGNAWDGYNQLMVTCTSTYIITMRLLLSSRFYKRGTLYLMHNNTNIPMGSVNTKGNMQSISTIRDLKSGDSVQFKLLIDGMLKDVCVSGGDLSTSLEVVCLN